MKDVGGYIYSRAFKLNPQKLFCNLKLVFNGIIKLSGIQMFIYFRRKDDDELSEEVFTEQTQQNIYDNESYNFTEDTINWFQPNNISLVRVKYIFIYDLMCL